MLFHNQNMQLALQKLITAVKAETYLVTANLCEVIDKPKSVCDVKCEYNCATNIISNLRASVVVCVTSCTTGPFLTF